MATFLAVLWSSWLPVAAGAQVNHNVLDALLNAYVHGDGVDYQGLKSRQNELAGYVASLDEVDASAHGFESVGFSGRERMALFINAYNACTLLLIVEHFSGDLKSIKDIPAGERWKHVRWKIGGRKYSLDAIEHEVLRGEFKDARIHTVINCASVGCPSLRAEAFRGRKLERQLDEQCRRFVNDAKHVRVVDGKLRVSKLFKWFKEDFTRDGNSVPGFILRYADDALRAQVERLGLKPRIEYLEYDWSLNGVKSEGTKARKHGDTK